MRWISGQFWENSITDSLVLKIRLTTSMIGLVWILDEGRDFELSRRSFRELFALYLDSLGRQLTLSDFDLDGVLACFMVSFCFLFCFSCGFEKQLISSSEFGRLYHSCVVFIAFLVPLVLVEVFSFQVNELKSLLARV